MLNDTTKTKSVPSIKVWKMLMQLLINTIIHCKFIIISNLWCICENGKKKCMLANRYIIHTEADPANKESSQRL